jgi:hypothetical protein
MSISSLARAILALQVALARFAWSVFAPRCASTLAVVQAQRPSAVPARLELANLAAFATYRAAVALDVG